MDDCPTTAPVCDAGSCRLCKTDDECPSTVCDIDQGLCVAPTSIVYAAPDGNDANICSQAAACTATKAVTLVDTQHPWVRMLPGTYGVTITSSNTFNLVGTGAVITGGSVGTLSNGNISIRGLTMDQFLCQAADSAMSVRDLKAGAGLAGNGSSNGCQLSMLNVELGAGISLGDLFIDSTTVIIDRCKLRTVHMNRSSSQTFSLSITNSIVQSVDPSGLSASPPVTVLAAYNTFFDPASPSVACDTDANTPSGILFENNIFYSPGASDSISSGGTNCRFSNNIAFPQSTSIGANTIVLDPNLVDAPAGDFHLVIGSPAIDAAVVIPNDPTIDYDGTPRPQGPRSDIGAFEFK